MIWKFIEDMKINGVGAVEEGLKVFCPVTKDLLMVLEKSVPTC